MISMDMGFQRGDQLQIQFFNQRGIPARLFEHGIDQNSLTPF